MIPKDLARKIRAIQIYTTRMVDDVLAGQYHSAFKGRGMEFEEVREYFPGDDTRNIDWNVTARAGKPYVKNFREERELTVMLVVDLSASGRFGGIEQLKNEMAAEVAALLAFSAVRNNDKVGLMAFTDRVETFIPPKKGTRHVLRVIREILTFQPKHAGTNITEALDYLGRVLHKRAVVFLISDFIASGFERRLRMITRRHDLVAVTVTDSRERDLPPVGLIEMEDAETGETLLVDTSDERVRPAFRELAEERLRKLTELFRSAGIDSANVEAGRPYLRELARLFKNRERRSRR